MKIAVAFLCLSVASFIGTSKGGEPHTETTIDIEELVELTIITLEEYDAEQQCQADCDTKTTTTVTHIVVNLKKITDNCGLDLATFLKGCGCDEDLINAIVEGNLDYCLSQRDMSYYLKIYVCFVEVICAKGGYLLLDLLEEICESLGWGRLLVHVNGILYKTVDDVLSGGLCLVVNQLISDAGVVLHIVVVVVSEIVSEVVEKVLAALTGVVPTLLNGVVTGVVPTLLNGVVPTLLNSR